MNQQPTEKKPADLQAEDLFLKRLAIAPGLEEVHAWVVDGVATITGRVRDDVDVLRVEKIAETVPDIIELKKMLKVDPTLQIEQKLDLEVPAVEAANTGDVNLNFPTVDARTESQIPVEVPPDAGQIEDIVQVESVLGAVPITGDPVSVVDAGVVDAIKVSGSEVTADDLAYHIKEGMPVLDVEGKKVGNVKAVRHTDFLLDRPLARDLYVPYFECTLEEDHLRLNDVKANEVGDQGWALSR